MFTPQWSDKSSIEPDILALAKTIDKSDANYSQAIAQSALALAFEILGPAAILSVNLDNLPEKVTDINTASQYNASFNNLMSAQEASTTIKTLAQSHYCAMPLRNMSAEQCAAVYQAQVIDIAKRLVKNTLEKDALFLTDEALDQVAQTIVQKKISDAAAKTLSITDKKYYDQLWALSAKIESTSGVSKDNAEKIGNLWGGPPATWNLIAMSSNHAFTQAEHAQANQNINNIDQNIANKFAAFQAQIQKRNFAPQPPLPIHSATELPVHIDFKPAVEKLPEDFGFQPLEMYKTICAFAKPSFNLANKMMQSTSEKLVLNK